ncbi:FAD/NAD-P-binding domain-containing protein [Trametes elegans]|nr:FAD/NAD-P-binding domain-containing protein [Trametes elegans]
MSSSFSSSTPRIAIIGGGPSGLVLLLTLTKRGVPATLYEREADSHSRAHLGGMLDLEWDSGQRALRENGLEDAFKKYSRRDAEETKLCTKDGKVLLHRSGGDPGDDNLEKARPEVDRRILRQILVDAVPADSIKWGHALSAIRPLGGGEHELTFANGVVTVADIVVGADGAHSRIRPLVSPAVPLYHGINGAEVSVAPEVAARPENRDVSERVGAGSCYVLHSGKMFGFQRNGDGRIRLYAWHRAPLEWALPADPKAAKAALLELYADFAPWMRKFIELGDESAIYPRPLFYLPVDHRWLHTPGVTLIGDAAHLMSPFSGMGANLAMRDGLDLGLALAEAVSKGADAEEREKAIAVWEEKMYEQVHKFAQFTFNNLELAFRPDSPWPAYEVWKAHLGEEAVPSADKGDDV